MKTTDLKWLSVWCRRFAVNFGDMFFPEDLTLEQAGDDDENDVEDESIPEDLPPPLIEPVNSHDPSHRDHDWKDDPDAYSAAESEGTVNPRNCCILKQIAEFTKKLELW